MTSADNIPTVALDDFIRRFAVRNSKLMWFLGAGASASAGLPTAFDLVWQFKRDLYVSQSHGNSDVAVDLSQAATRHRIDAHIASVEWLPSPGDKDEYAALFEEAYPSEGDRQFVIESYARDGKPSYGHIALAALMRADIARIVWTTNFDKLIADACAKVFDGTSALTTASLDAPDIADHALERERWPLEVKLHGDFHSRRLKNTGKELRHQDARLRDLLQAACGRYGLIVVGYSGRDDSIVRVLAQALDLPKPFPTGLFWLRRDDDPIFDAVAELLQKSLEVGVETAFVTIHSFDETLRDIARFVKIDQKVLDAHSPKRERPTPPRPRDPMRQATLDIFLEKGRVQDRIQELFPKDEDRPIRERATELARMFGRTMNRDDVEDDEAVGDLVNLSIELAPHIALDARMTEAGERANTPLGLLTTLLRTVRIAELSSFGRIADDRLKVIQRLDVLKEDDGIREDSFQHLIEDAPWLLNPEWVPVTANRSLSSLRKEFEHYYKRNTGQTIRLSDFTSPSMRPNFVLLSQDGKVQMVEIKRPGHVLKNDEMERIVNYHNLMRSFLEDSKNEAFRQLIHGFHITLVCDELALSRLLETVLAAYVERGVLTHLGWASFLRRAKDVHRVFLKEVGRQSALAVGRH